MITITVNAADLAYLHAFFDSNDIDTKYTAKQIEDALLAVNFDLEKSASIKVPTKTVGILYDTLSSQPEALTAKINARIEELIFTQMITNLALRGFNVVVGKDESGLPILDLEKSRDQNTKELPEEAQLLSDLLRKSNATKRSREALLNDQVNYIKAITGYVEPVANPVPPAPPVMPEA